jgi:PAS domain S-box-containing protein
METHFPAILIKAKIKNQLLLLNYLEDSLKAKFYLSKTINETFTFLQRIKIDLIIFEITFAKSRKIHIGNLHKTLSLEGLIPILYIVPGELQKMISLEDLKTGTFDLLTLPFDKFLFVNRVKLFLQIKGINAASGKLQNKHVLTHHTNENSATMLYERTKQLSSEIHDHIKTKVELYHQNIRLDENQHVFSDLLNTIPNPLVIKNSKGEYIQCNRAFEQFCGIKLSEIKGKTAFDFFDQGFATKFEQSDKDRLKSKKTSVQEHSLIKPDGTVIHLMIYKNIFPFGKYTEPGTITTIVDITHIKSEEDLLELQSTVNYLASLDKEKTAELQNKVRDLEIEAHQHNLTKNALINLQNNIPIGIFSTSPKGEILYGNPAIFKIFGYDSMDEMSKISVMDLYYSKEKRDELLQILLTKGQLPGTEVQLLRKDKSTFWGLIRAQAVFDKQGKPVQYDGVVEDISERKLAKIQLEEAHKEILLINRNLKLKVEEALEKQEDQYSLLIQKSKLESLGELSAGIAHEINQPLGVIAMSLENLKHKMVSNTITPQYLDSKFQSINDNIKRIRNIIDHIRIFSREQDSFVLDKVNINEVVQNALSMIGTQYRNHNINIWLDLKENIGFTVGSELKLEQVILNLLANAKYALDEKGILKGETEFSKEIQIKTDTTPDKIILIIEDNGIGIEAKNLTRIFDPFFTTKPEGYGTGLGLSIVYGLVKDMRGEIFVTSKEKKYTKFKIIFPRFPEKN